jgi:hypothetical protein
MWWDPTCEDFKSSDNGLVDGLGMLSRSKVRLFQEMMESLEIRVEEHKTARKPNKFLLVLARAMRDACSRLGTLKTTFREMRFGVTKFQRYYLEVLGFLDYLEVFTPRNLKPPLSQTV